jgi:hypothetical protein
MPDDITTGLSAGGDSGTLDTTTSTDTGSAPITWNEDARVIPPGAKDPVSWKDYSSGFVSKADLTRMRQQDAAALQREREAIQRQEQQLRRSAELVAQRFPQQPGQPQADPFGELEALPYVDGKAAAGMARHIVQRGLQPLAQAFQQQQQENHLLMQRIAQLEKGVGTFTTQRAESDLKSLIDRTTTAVGYGNNPVVEQMALDLYHSHTGWETDPTAFETMLKARIDQVRSFHREQDKKKADEARLATRVPAPGRGGQARPGKPLATGFETPEQLANRLYPGMQTPNS